MNNEVPSCRVYKISIAIHSHSYKVLLLECGDVATADVKEAIHLALFQSMITTVRDFRLGLKYGKLGYR